MKLNAFFASVLIVLLMFFTVAVPKAQAFSEDPFEVGHYAIEMVQGLTLEWMYQSDTDFQYWEENIDNHENGMYSHFWGLLAESNTSIEHQCDIGVSHSPWTYATDLEICINYAYDMADQVTNTYECHYLC